MQKVILQSAYGKIDEDKTYFLAGFLAFFFPSAFPAAKEIGGDSYESNVAEGGWKLGWTAW